MRRISVNVKSPEARENRTVSSMAAPTGHNLRRIARVAARNAFRRVQIADAQLLDEARMTDRLSCTDAEMLVLLHHATPGRQ